MSRFKGAKISYDGFMVFFLILMTRVFVVDVLDYSQTAFYRLLRELIVRFLSTEL